MRRAPASHAETDASNWEIARIAAECFEVGQIFGDACDFWKGMTRKNHFTPGSFLVCYDLLRVVYMCILNVPAEQSLFVPQISRAWGRVCHFGFQSVRSHREECA